MTAPDRPVLPLLEIVDMAQGPELVAVFDAATDARAARDRDPSHGFYDALGRKLSFADGSLSVAGQPENDEVRAGFLNACKGLQDELNSFVQLADSGATAEELVRALVGHEADASGGGLRLGLFGKLAKIFGGKK
jgi:hypothetical protein